MGLVKDIYVLDLDKNPDEIHGGRWISEQELLNWLDEAIESMDISQKIRSTEWREAMKSAYESIKRYMR